MVIVIPYLIVLWVPLFVTSELLCFRAVFGNPTNEEKPTNEE